jgi:tyrosyl-tRNA synthetase
LSEIVNLRRARKQKNREIKQAEAAERRAVFGRSKAEKRLSESERALAETQLDARRLAPLDGDD